MVRPANHDAARTMGRLLIDSIPGEEQDFPFAQLGQGLATAGFIALLAGILAVILSSPSLDLGWEGNWYVPRGELAFVIPLSLALMAAGGILYILGRRGQRPSPDDGCGPAPGQELAGNGK